MMTLVKRNPQTTYDDFAAAPGKSRSTVMRHIAKLKASGKLLRVGLNKNGHWKVPSSRTSRQAFLNFFLKFSDQL
jgi:predicted HTH transcriptional regulator